ncbi:antibiotic biosynthesis monooxygenase [Streptomyces sp. NPDC023588]|uniref:antibiotic biosynthesis monooxygenase n=1 Tax=Streptomyces sp. NPDC023588 TaxID=3154907 RepID=UPI003403A5C6
MTPTTTVEYIRYRIALEDQEALKTAYARAAASLAASPECIDHELSHCEEERERYVLRIRWTSVDAHLGRLFRILPGPRPLAPHLAALSARPGTSSTRHAPPPCQARHQTPRARPTRSERDGQGGFRKGGRFPAFSSAIRPYVAAIEEMQHYTVTGVAGTGKGAGER